MKDLFTTAIAVPGKEWVKLLTKTKLVINCFPQCLFQWTHHLCLLYIWINFKVWNTHHINIKNLFLNITKVFWNFLHKGTKLSIRTLGYINLYIDIHIYFRNSQTVSARFYILTPFAEKCRSNMKYLVAW